MKLTRFLLRASSEGLAEKKNVASKSKGNGKEYGAKLRHDVFYDEI